MTTEVNPLGMPESPQLTDEERIAAELEESILGPSKPKARKPRAKKQEAPPAMNWSFLSDAMYPVIEPAYARFEVPLDKQAFASCVGAWGRVLEKYMPTLQGYEEETTALLLTAAIGLPLVQAIMAERAKHAKAKPQQNTGGVSEKTSPENDRVSRGAV